MKYLRETYGTYGFKHTLITRWTSIYIYQKTCALTGRHISYEVFKANVRRPLKSKYYDKKTWWHEYPHDEDFGYRAFSIVDKNRAFEKFQALIEKYYPN